MMKNDSNPDALLAELAAERSIRRLITAYCDALIRRDLDAMRALYTDDCRVQIASMPVRTGIEAQMEGLRQTFAAHSFLHQRCDANLLEVTGDRARGRLLVFETTRQTGKDDLNQVFGIYEDEYARLPEGWRFKTRKFTLKLKATLPVSVLNEFPELVPAFAIRP